MAIRILIKASNKGLGRVKPFGTFGKAEKGGLVFVGEKEYKVDGRGYITIPKKVMDKYGLKDKTGKRNIVMQFSAKPGIEGWKEASAVVSKALKEYVNFKNGARVSNIGKAKRNKKNEYTNRLVPIDFPEQNYSP
jgi:bifunctional DNA-binding transcriptional regulator/antitoxin component of YhaV-PrlF toxin-antitoxin module